MAIPNTSNAGGPLWYFLYYMIIGQIAVYLRHQLLNGYINERQYVNDTTNERPDVYESTNETQI